jgi:hypothetical protein
VPDDPVEKHARRGKTISAVKTPKVSLRLIRDEADAIEKEIGPVERPRVRGDCAEFAPDGTYLGPRGPRPCPFVACRHNLFLDVLDAGAIHMNVAGREPGEVPASASCALDVAEDGGVVLDEIGKALGVTRERARQIEERALGRLVWLMKRSGIDEQLLADGGFAKALSGGAFGDEMLSNRTTGLKRLEPPVAEEEPEEERSVVPRLPSILDESVSDEQYADAVYRLYEERAAARARAEEAGTRVPVPGTIS